MRDLTDVEIAQVSGAGVGETLGRWYGEAYAWYEANIAAIHQGQLSKSRP
ncbi:MAG TPA: hypothetical protein VIP30_03545 [Stenotrophomonas sp.]|jgi:hypothetical protein